MNPAQLKSFSNSEFLALLREREIELRLHEGKLRISAPAGVLDDALKVELGRRKQMLHVYAETRSLREVKDDSDAPLSYAQERLWLLERFHPGNFAYNIPESAQIDGPVDPTIMQRAIDIVMQRHASLRTSFTEDAQGKASQHIHESVVAPLEIVGVGHIPVAEREARIQELLRELARKPFDLRTAPLVRFYLLRFDTEKHVVFINIHHIVSDQWSMRILRRELLTAYAALASGVEPVLPTLPMQYADYAHRERAISPQEKFIKQLDYWRKQLADAPEPLQLPFQRAPLVEKPIDGAIQGLELTEADAAAIRSIAQAHHASPYMVLLAAFFALLHRYTSATDLCIGTPVSERTSTDTEALIGLFVNTLVLRCNIASELTFEELLTRIRETVLDAQGNREVPLQRILSELHPVTAGRSLFRTIFAFDAYMGGEEETQLAFDPGFAKLDLTLQMYEQRSRFGGWFEYRTDLYTAEDMARFAEAFVLLIRDAMADPAKKVARLTILTEEEKVRLLVERNATHADFPRDRTMHRLFEEQVEKTPDATALIDGEERITYRELNRRANRVAHHLLARGVSVESIVGLRMERSADMVAAMLGVLKAGCGYLPLDPRYPADRLKFMIEDSQCGIVLDDTLGDTLSDDSGDDKIDNPITAVSPSNLAYVIYTSGSTGRPKGVAIEHHSVVSFLHWARKTFPTESLQGTLASTSISFDLSVFEIFVPLVCGQKVILANDILAFSKLPAAAEVTLMTMVPSAAAALLDGGSIPDTVRAIHLAGEALTPSLVDRLYAETSVAEVNDLYGPTETTTYSTWSRRFPRGPATIGRPLPNTRIYIVNPALELAPDGQAGELLIAGEGVARGYLHRPDLTAERFVSLTHLGVHDRAYRTGDLCRYLSDGALADGTLANGRIAECPLAYLGRLDNQVKVRGFRIELGEVEAVLQSHSSIRDAVVVVRSDGDAGASLAAAVVLQPAQTLDLPALISHQARRLPDSMVAKSIFAVDALPHTANGKVDRKQLLAVLSSLSADWNEAEPQDPLQRELVHIWKEGFGIQGIGIDDDFFRLGGHSLLALRLFSEIEARLGHRLMLSILFQAPTIRQLADTIRNQSS
jgi:amino acid adenylation domain-containing protein